MLKLFKRREGSVSMDKFTLNQQETLLMVIDIQERLIPPMKYGKQVIKKTNILITIAEDFGDSCYRHGTIS
jgi:hypothetical protein